MTKIKGDKYKTVVVTDSDETIIVDKKASIYGGGKIDGTDLNFGHGIIEDIVGTPGIDGNTYIINGRVKGLLGGVTTFGDDTTIKLGKTADVSAALGIGIGSLDFSDPAAIETLSLGSVSAGGDDSKISISKGASIGGLIGASVLGRNSSISNSGDISGSLVGMIGGDLASLAGGLVGGKQAASPGADVKTSLINNGHVDAAIGLIGIGTGDDLSIVNGKKGEIIGYFMGIGAIDASGSGHTEINNAGTIRVTMSIPEGVIPIPGLSSAAILGLGSVDTIRNTGKIFGDIILLDGDDTVNNVGGKIAGDILGGAGDDTLIVGSAKDKLVEIDGEGTDTVKSAFDYTLSDFVEKLILTGKKDIDGTGNAGDNRLVGNKGGDNTLTGDLGFDTFVFATKGGHDTIADFTVLDDTLDLSGWKKMVDFAFLSTHADEKNGDVVVTVGKDVLVIENHTLADLSTANIDYAV